MICFCLVYNLNKCRLMDLGSSGPPLTWSNGWLGLENTFDCLDRRIKFLEASVTNIRRMYSDHYLILVSTKCNPLINRNRPFSFLTSWSEHLNCDELINKSWENNTSLTPNMVSYTNDIQKWNREFMAIFLGIKIKLKLNLKRYKLRKCDTTHIIWIGYRKIFGNI